MTHHNFSLKKTQKGVDIPQTLRISNKGLHLNFKVLRFHDNDSNMTVLYCPVLEISGYGDTFEEASELLNIEMNNFFEHFQTLSHKNQILLLHDLGWKQNKYHNKEFSNCFVDMDGVLQNFNVDKEDIEVMSLATAE